MLEILLLLLYFLKSCGSFGKYEKVYAFMVDFMSFLEQPHNFILSHPQSDIFHFILIQLQRRNRYRYIFIPDVKFTSQL